MAREMSISDSTAAASAAAQLSKAMSGPNVVDGEEDEDDSSEASRPHRATLTRTL